MILHFFVWTDSDVHLLIRVRALGTQMLGCGFSLNSVREPLRRTMFLSEIRYARNALPEDSRQYNSFISPFPAVSCTPLIDVCFGSKHVEPTSG